MRKKAKNEFERDYYKLLNYAVFGKTMENLRNRVNIKLIHDEDILKRYCSKITFQHCKFFNENLAGVQFQKQKIILDRPNYIGFCVLDLSKIVMYGFHYNYMLAKYNSNCKLLFTDTDSLTYITYCEDIDKDMLSNLDLFDTSNYPPDNLLYSTKNKKVVGRMKDETSSVPIREFVGLRAKMYAYVFDTHTKKNCQRNFSLDG